jgi:raffinose/stachyose/melibiose transport system permease protein
MTLLTARRPGAGPSAGPVRRRRAPRRGSRLSTAITLVVVVLVLAPVVYMIVTSLRSDGDVSGSSIGLPTHPAWSNYTAAISGMNYWRSAANTVIITGGTAVLTVLMGSLAAWAITRCVRGWTKLVYRLFLAGLTVPVFVFLTPLYMMLRSAHLLDSYQGTILVYTAINLPFAVFFYCSFLRSVPAELEEAATVDGASVLRVFWSVIFPLLRPATATLCILVTLAVWNDLVIPLLLLSSDNMQTVTQATYSFIGTYGVKTSQLFPAVVLACAPIVVLFLILQRHIVAGITAGVGKS